ncbi:unnamed protein product [Echinostoma caproni]|uniref:ULP_PROTEASE domain-containing protein n=1 Tax=Echinostoma caproni TaxID=27848 RepID=A0A183AJ95_9TREM|nr:unnamed protein product [Echinostoma caproni]
MLTSKHDRIYTMNNPYHNLAKSHGSRSSTTHTTTNAESAGRRKPWNPSVRIDQSWVTYQTPINNKTKNYLKDRLTRGEQNKSITRKSQPWTLPFPYVPKEHSPAGEIVSDKKDLSDIPPITEDQTTVRDLTDELVPVMSTAPVGVDSTHKGPRIQSIEKLVPRSTHQNPERKSASTMAAPTSTTESASSTVNLLLSTCADLENLISRICVWYVKARTAIDTIHSQTDPRVNNQVLYALISDYLNQLQTLLGTYLPNDLCITRWMHTISHGNRNDTGLTHASSSVVFVESQSGDKNSIQDRWVRAGNRYVRGEKSEAVEDSTSADIGRHLPTPWVTVQSTQTQGVETSVLDPISTQSTDPNLMCHMEGDINTNCCSRSVRLDSHAYTGQFTFCRKSTDMSDENTNGNNASQTPGILQNLFELYHDGQITHNSAQGVGRNEQRRMRTVELPYKSDKRKCRMDCLGRIIIHQACQIFYPIVEWITSDECAVIEQVRIPSCRIIQQYTSDQPTGNVYVYHSSPSWVLRSHIESVVVESHHCPERVLIVETVPRREPTMGWMVSPDTMPSENRWSDSTVQVVPSWIDGHSLFSLPAPPEELLTELEDYIPMCEPELVDCVHDYENKLEMTDDGWMSTVMQRTLESGKKPCTPYLLWKCGSTRTDSHLNDYICPVDLCLALT